jgi:putative heme iron utilization protein
MTDTPAATARALLRELGAAALGTLIDGRPYVSLALTAPDADGAPLLLLSDLAQHTRNLAADTDVSMLFDGTRGSADPLDGARLTLLGTIRRHDDGAARALYVARHPSAARYESFSDFHLYRVEPARAQLVAGFGRIDWIEGAALLG